MAVTHQNIRFESRSREGSPDLPISGAGGTTGHDIINSFRAAEGASHDVIQIDASIAKSLSELAVHVVGHDTIIELGHNASIMLKDVVAPLTSHEVLIV